MCLVKKTTGFVERKEYATIDDAIIDVISEHSRKSKWRLGMLQNDLFRSLRIFGYTQKDINGALSRMVNDPERWGAELRNAEVNKRYRLIKQDPNATKEQIKQFARENFVEVLGIGNENDSVVYMEKWATDKKTGEKFQAAWATRYWYVGNKYRIEKKALEKKR